MKLTPYIVVWACLAVVVLALALARYLVSFREDDTIHLSTSERGLITNQMVIFRWLDAIDRWGKSLTVLTLVSGLILAAFYLVQSLP
jgi:hypothetical protein